MANLNANVTVNINLDAQAAAAKSFSSHLIVDAAGMTGRILFFESDSAAREAKEDNLITQAQLDAILSILSQSPRPAKVAAGRGAVTETAQVSTLTLSGTVAVGDVLTLNAGGASVQYAVQNGDGLTEAAAGLQALFAAEGEPITAVAAAAVITFTADNAGDGFSLSFASTGATVGTIATTTPNQSITEELEAIYQASREWYGFTLVNREAENQRRAAAWAESKNFDVLFIGQSNDADVKQNVTTDIASILKTAGYNQSALLWFSDDDVPAAESWAGTKLALDLNTGVTTWAYKQLKGITPDDANISETEKLILEGKNANVYLTFGGIGATGAGVVASGKNIDVITTSAWFKARVFEAIAKAFRDASERNSRIPFTDAGFAVIAAAIGGVLDEGVALGHFEETEDGASPYINTPARSSLSDPLVAAKTLPIECGALISGSLYKVVVTGNLTESTSTIALLAEVVQVAA